MNAKDFVSIRDLSPSEMEYLLILGRQMKAHPSTYSETLRGKTLAMIFEKPSLRTRVSFDVGIHQLVDIAYTFRRMKSNSGNASRSTMWRRTLSAWCRAS